MRIDIGNTLPYDGEKENPLNPYAAIKAAKIQRVEISN